MMWQQLDDTDDVADDDVCRHGRMHDFDSRYFNVSSKMSIPKDLTTITNNNEQKVFKKLPITSSEKNGNFWMIHPIDDAIATTTPWSFPTNNGDKLIKYYVELYIGIDKYNIHQLSIPTIHEVSNFKHENLYTFTCAKIEEKYPKFYLSWFAIYEKETNRIFKKTSKYLIEKNTHLFEYYKNRKNKKIDVKILSLVGIIKYNDTLSSVSNKLKMCNPKWIYSHGE